MATKVATSLTITNPLVKYRALVATKAISSDPSQLRLALHLQNLYERLKDYEPELEYSTRLDQISKSIAKSNGSSSAPSRWRTFLAAKERRDSLALTRRLTSHESALQLTSPMGLMLHGEVGTGKSMLVDLFADCLPNRKKRRWHFNTFMLETFSKLEALRRSRLIGSPAATLDVVQDDEYSLLWLAKEMIETSPILFLDEFQMPDRTASKILTNLMTSFFQLGGVLVATSNRMPEELAKASGMEFPAPAQSTGPARWSWGQSSKSRSDGLFGGANEFAKFLEVLRARCEVWEMEGGKDYRRVGSGRSKAPVRQETKEEWRVDGHQDYQHAVGMAGWLAENEDANAGVEKEDAAVEEEGDVNMPTYYSTKASDGIEQHHVALVDAVAEATGLALGTDVPWSSSSMKVYGRTIVIPRVYQDVTMWSFAELCNTSLGPADYITLASTYHTVILSDVPILTWLMKNEARRFITLLDALYECRCKLYMVDAAAGPDELFFPDRPSGREGEEGGDAVYAETLAEIYQDSTAPFRPNILSDNPNYAEQDPNPNYTHARLAGLMNADQIEDDPPNKPAKKPFGRSFGRTDGEMEKEPIDPDDALPLAGRRGPDFGKTSAFTGEDERFAYKRAQSRLWELCGERWWARSEPDWHRPLPIEVRRWEKSMAEQTAAALAANVGSAATDARMGSSQLDETRDQRSFRQKKMSVSEAESSSPFRTEKEPPPKIGWTHFWGTTVWGKRAGRWGQGAEGLKEDETKRE